MNEGRETGSAVYGMTSRARCLAALAVPLTGGLPANVLGRFVLGSQGAASGDDNELRLVEVREQATPGGSSLAVRELALLPHPPGEVWALAACPQVPDLVFTAARDAAGAARTSLFRIPAAVLGHGAGAPEGAPAGPVVAALEHVGSGASTAATEVPATVRTAAWDPQAAPQQPRLAVGDAVGCVRIVGVREDGRTESDVLACGAPVVKAADGGVQEVRWACAGRALVAVAGGAGVAAYDARCAPGEGAAWTLARGVVCGRVHSADWNPLAVHRVATTGEDGFVRLWDVRAPRPRELLALRVHSHWGTTVRYSPHHDELLLTGGTDGTVALTYAPTAAAAADPAVRALAEATQDSPAATAAASPVGAAAAAAAAATATHVGEDTVVRTYREHEDSVYAVEWCPVAAGALWAFASLSYAGRLLVSAVPRKYCDLARYC